MGTNTKIHIKCRKMQKVKIKEKKSKKEQKSEIKRQTDIKIELNLSKTSKQIPKIDLKKTKKWYNGK